jgi:tRNA threonylcarbamoyladenosine biosynthesis protein TsaB
VRRILVANDARMKEVYSAWFEVEGTLTSGPETVGPAADVLVPPGNATRWAAAGRGLRVWPALAERCRASGASLHVDLLPRASEVLALARSAVRDGQIVDPAAALPVYVRDRVAESSL